MGAAGDRKDGRNLVEKARDMGFQVAETKEEFESLDYSTG